MNDCEHNFYYHFEVKGDPDHGPPYWVIQQLCDLCSHTQERCLSDEDLEQIWKNQDASEQ